MTIITRRAALKLGGAGLLGSVSGTLGRRALASLPTEDDGIQKSERQKMSDVALSFMKRFDVPGLSLAIARNGRMVYREPFGFADRDRGEELSRDHLFRIASVSKTLTAVAIFTLVQSGRVHLDDRVFGEGSLFGTKYGKSPYRKYVEEITVDHLLTHTCGGWEKGSFDPMFCRYDLETKEELIARMIYNRPLDYRPGKHWAYSNFGYCILGRIIEAKTGVDYETYLSTAVLNPCGITDMRIGLSKREQRVSNEVVYYGQNGEDPYDIRLERMDSNGGWIATPADLVHFAISVGGFDNAQQILNTQTINSMTEPCSVNTADARGWGINENGAWTHSGSLAGTSAVILRTPPSQGGLCWAAITNTRRPPEEAMNQALSGMIREMARELCDCNV